MRLARSIRLILLAALIGAAFPLASASAQGVIALVNGEPITAHDLASRIKLIQGSNPRPPAREEVLEELVNEKLKLQQAKRLDITIPDSDVDRALDTIAQRSGRNSSALIAQLNQQGIDVQTLKNRLRADFAWRKVLEKIAPGVLMVRDADIVAIMMARGQQPQTTAVQYSMRQFVFVLPRNAPDAARVARQREADAFRSRVSSCEEALQLIREHREVVIKDPVVRM